MAKVDDRENAIIGAVADFALTGFLVTDPVIRQSLMQMLDQMCGSAESIVWLGRHIRDHYTEWPGASTVRGVYCTRYKPKDGIEVDLPPGDPTYRETEQRAVEAHEEHKRLPESALDMVRELTGTAATEDQQKFRAQTQRWINLCKRYPVERVFRSLSNEFIGADTSRREEILRQIAGKLDRLPVSTGGDDA